ncbi:MAG: hypothetical protein GWP15_01585, partial [Nitrospirae bacterium]|nr:hypothetical protein [Nitrospirota bacterium]
MRSRTPICDRVDEEQKICAEVLRTGTFGKSLSKLKPSEINSLQESFHIAVTSFLDGLDCESNEFRSRNARVGTAFNELLE